MKLIGNNAFIIIWSVVLVFNIFNFTDRSIVWIIISSIMVAFNIYTNVARYIKKKKIEEDDAF